jgi:outer membrane PBP1 activator LpoA protein
LNTSKTLQQVLLEAEVLLQNKQFAEALQLLQSVDSRAHEVDDRAKYCLLLTEAGLFAGDYSDDIIDEAIEAYRFDHRPEYFAKAKYLKGRRLTSLGNYSDAKEHLLEA